MSKEIIDLKPEKPDEGKIRYTYSGKPLRVEEPLQRLVARVVSFVIGASILLLLLYFFVYVVLPIIVILFIWMLLRNLFKKA